MSFPLGGHLSDIAREKISIANTGRIVSAETRRKIAMSKLGKPRSLELKAKLSGPKNPRWKGGGTYSRGYRVLYLGPNKRMMEHRFVMERQIGRPLRPGEHVHHIDGNKTNNDPANLIILTAQDHGYEHLLKLRQEIVDLRALVAEKDAIIRQLEKER